MHSNPACHICMPQKGSAGSRGANNTQTNMHNRPPPCDTVETPFPHRTAPRARAAHADAQMAQRHDAVHEGPLGASEDRTRIPPRRLLTEHRAHLRQRGATHPQQATRPIGARNDNIKSNQNSSKSKQVCILTVPTTTPTRASGGLGATTSAANAPGGAAAMSARAASMRRTRARRRKPTSAAPMRERAKLSTARRAACGAAMRARYRGRMRARNDTIIMHTNSAKTHARCCCGIRGSVVSKSVTAHTTTATQAAGGGSAASTRRLDRGARHRRHGLGRRRRTRWRSCAWHKNGRRDSTRGAHDSRCRAHGHGRIRR